MGVARTLADSSDFGPGGAKFTKTGDSLLWRSRNGCAKFEPLALSSTEKFLTVQTNKHTNKQTVNNISSHRLSACVDINQLMYINL